MRIIWQALNVHPIANEIVDVQPTQEEVCNVHHCWSDRACRSVRSKRVQLQRTKKRMKNHVLCQITQSNQGPPDISTPGNAGPNLRERERWGPQVSLVEVCRCHAVARHPSSRQSANRPNPRGSIQTHSTHRPSHATNVIAFSILQQWAPTCPNSLPPWRMLSRIFPFQSSPWVRSPSASSCTSLLGSCQSSAAARRRRERRVWQKK